MDEINLRKEVIDSMSKSLLQHENDSAQLAQTLVMLKNQIMDHKVGEAVKRKYAGVKTSTLKNVPVTVRQFFLYIFVQIEFIEEKDNYFLQVEGKNYSLNINFELIDSFTENKENKLQLNYFLPNTDSPGSKMKRMSEVFECCENEEIIKVFKNISRSIEMDDRRQFMRRSQSFLI